MSNKLLSKTKPNKVHRIQRVVHFFVFKNQYKHFLNDACVFYMLTNIYFLIREQIAYFGVLNLKNYINSVLSLFLSAFIEPCSNN